MPATAPWSPPPPVVDADVGPEDPRHQSEVQLAQNTSFSEHSQRSAVPEPVQVREGERVAETFDVVSDVENEAPVVSAVQRAP